MHLKHNTTIVTIMFIKSKWFTKNDEGTQTNTVCGKIFNIEDFFEELIVLQCLKNTKK